MFFLTLRVIPKYDINDIDILIDELPDLFNERKEKGLFKCFKHVFQI